MDREETLRRRLHDVGNSIDATPPPLGDLLLREVPARPPRTRGRRVAALAMSAACAATAVAVIGAVRTDPTTSSIDQRQTTPLATNPTSTTVDVSSSTTEPLASDGPSPIVLDVPGCRDLKAYEVAAAPTAPGDVNGTWYIPATDDHAGGWGFVYAPGGAPVPPSLSGPDVSSTVQVSDDGTGTYDWVSEGSAIARMSTRGMDRPTIERLADGISDDNIEDLGYIALPTPQRQARILGTSCRRGDDLLAVEVAIGDLAAQVDHFGSSDPTSIEFEGGHAVATFGNSPGETLPTRTVPSHEWQELLDATGAAGSP